MLLKKLWWQRAVCFVKMIVRWIQMHWFRYCVKCMANEVFSTSFVVGGQLVFRVTIKHLKIKACLQLLVFFF